MREISAAQRELILDVVGEGLSPLPAGVLEKDLLVTAVLRSLADFRGSAEIVFCGGTCLSKAHGLVRRMSEDVDFKIRMPASASRGSARRALSDLKHALAGHLRNAGHALPADAVEGRAENTKISLRVHYDSRFPAVASLRPEIRVQLVVSPPRLAVEVRPVGSLLAEVVDLDEAPVPWLCVGVAETMAEKVVALLRRLAILDVTEERSGAGELIRHVYDVALIAKSKPDTLASGTRAVFRAAARADAREFAARDPVFAQTPFAAMQRSLEFLLEDRAGVLGSAYGQFAADMVYGEVPSFDEARELFASIAQRLLEEER
jgi:hypothetical protein